MKKEFPKREIILIEDNKSISHGDLTFISLRPNKILDPVYYSVVIINSKKEAIFYAPHGFTLNKKQLELVNKNKIKLLITTFTEFEIPKIMGGIVYLIKADLADIDFVKFPSDRENPEFIPL